MGVVQSIVGALFGGGANVIKDTAEVFRVNSEEQSQRDAENYRAALAQFTAEMARERVGVFDRLIDAMNRIPRPAMALGVIGLFVSAMIDPVWFAARMQGVALVPEPLWWLLGAIVSFYFGARYQSKGQDFQKSLAATMAVMADINRQDDAENAAIIDWRRSK